MHGAGGEDSMSMEQGRLLLMGIRKNLEFNMKDNGQLA
jgi:hypothetical protein